MNFHALPCQDPQDSKNKKVNSVTGRSRLGVKINQVRFRHSGASYLICDDPRSFWRKNGTFTTSKLSSSFFQSSDTRPDRILINVGLKSKNHVLELYWKQSHCGANWILKYDQQALISQATADDPKHGCDDAMTERLPLHRQSDMQGDTTSWS